MCPDCGHQWFSEVPNGNGNVRQLAEVPNGTGKARQL
jgi:hypothetical protein